MFVLEVLSGYSTGRAATCQDMIRAARGLYVPGVPQESGLRSNKPSMEVSAMNMWLVAGVTLGAMAGGVRSVIVSDFETGLGGWWTNDAPLHEKRSERTTLISIDRVRDPEGGPGHVLHIRFHAGSGWANAAVNFTDEGDAWAAPGVDEVRLRLRGDGSNRAVRVGFQAWDDELLRPLMFEQPVSLASREWREVRLPLETLEASLPGKRLRLPCLISFQVNGSGDLAPGELWIDDVRAVRAHGQGKRFAESPLAGRLATMTPVSGLPRLGNWEYPGRDRATLPQCKEIGIEFSSNLDPAVHQQHIWLEGIVTSHIVSRPSGAELIAGLGLTEADMDQDAAGNRAADGVVTSFFHPGALRRFESHVRDRVRTRRNAPWVASFVLPSPISMYGEVHYPPSTALGYLVHGTPAKANLRAWLRRQYHDDLPALCRAWDATYATWDDVDPPNGPTADPSGMDRRRSWSDFMHWYAGWLEEVSLRSLKAARSQTRKPVALMLGGPKIGLMQGICQGNVGPIARMLGRHRPAFLNDTDSQTLFSCGYTRAACSQYGIDLMVENVGPPYLQAFHQVNTVHNAIACGADYMHLSHLGELFDTKHWLHALWRDLAPVVRTYRTAYVKSDAAMFHSYLTSWYRADRSNGDCVKLYDSSNTLWFWDKGYPSWGRALRSPDVIDDAMVEDGALHGRKLLVIPNTGSTLTSRKAVEALRGWVRGGGRLVGFGKGCLEYTVEPDRRITRCGTMAGMLDAGDLAQAASDRFIERPFGKGTVVWHPRPVDPGSAFARECMKLLADQADRAGVRRWCRIEPGWDANLMYGGPDRVTGRHVFVLDLTRQARNGPEPQEFWKDRTFTLTFHPSLAGEAEIIAITDSFRGCSGAAAEWQPARRTLKLKLTLPARVVVDV